MSANGSLPGVIGGNNPPEPTPFDLARNAVEDLYGEAKHWLDGLPIVDQATADHVGVLLDGLRRAKADADAARKVEAKPHDDAKAEVQRRYKPIIDRAETAAHGCKSALGVWLRKVDAEKRERERLARIEADRIRADAEAAMRAAQPDDLEAREKAEHAVSIAQEAEAAAKWASNQKAQAKGGAKAVGLRTYWEPHVTDVNAAVRHYWTSRPEAFDELVWRLAKDDVLRGVRQIPGVEVRAEQRAV